MQITLKTKGLVSIEGYLYKLNAKDLKRVKKYIFSKNRSDEKHYELLDYIRENYEEIAILYANFNY